MHLLFGLLFLESLNPARSSLCLEDKRHESSDSSGLTHRTFVVPGEVYDEVVLSTFKGLERSRTGHAHEAGEGGEEILSDHTHPHEEGGEESDHSMSHLILYSIFGLVVVIVQARLLPQFPIPISILITGIIFAVICVHLSIFENHDGEHTLNIDSETIIFGFTPILVLGEILRTDVRLVKRMMLQFVFYGLVGGLLNTLCTTWILHAIMPSEWPFELLLSIGALLSTADASFVGSALATLGVPERVVVLIEGESINDAPMFTVLLIAKELYQRSELRTHEHLAAVHPIEGIAICVRLILSGIALGTLMGIAGLALLKFTSNRVDEGNAILQVIITLLVCYSTFLLAEVVFEMSGALALVTVGWLFAWKMWPLIISKDTVNSFWHALDFIAESLLYLVVGFYVGIEAYKVDVGKCIGYAVMMWAIAQTVRVSTLMMSGPLLNKLGPKLNFKELVLWSWCSLKGRVCLALITDFSIHLLDEDEGHAIKSEVIFVVGVVFLLSSIINGGLATFVARWLELDRTVELEDQIKSILLKHSIFKILRNNELLAAHTPHLCHFALSGDHDDNHHHADTISTTSLPCLGINWDSVKHEELVVSIRGLFLSVLKSLYWEENYDHEISIECIQILLTASDQAIEDTEKKPLSDFYHLMIIIPSRKDRTSDQYKSLYTLTTFVECHMNARDVFESDFMQAIHEIHGVGSPIAVALSSAWNEVKHESEKCEKLGKRELAVRFTNESIFAFNMLRHLNTHELENVMKSFADRGLISEKDVESSHEALAEDIEGIRRDLERIGENDDSGSANEVDNQHDSAAIADIEPLLRR